MAEAKTTIHSGERTVEDAEAVLQKIAAALANVVPDGGKAVILVSIDGKHIDCLHNMGSMDDAADAMRLYLDSRDEGRLAAREGKVRVN